MCLLVCLDVCVQYRGKEERLIVVYRIMHVPLHRRDSKSLLFVSGKTVCNELQALSLLSQIVISNYPFFCVMSLIPSPCLAITSYFIQSRQS